MQLVVWHIMPLRDKLSFCALKSGFRFEFLRCFNIWITNLSQRLFLKQFSLLLKVKWMIRTVIVIWLITYMRIESKR